MVTKLLLALGISVILAFVVEYLVMGMLISSLRDSEKAVVDNYRGTPVAYGLGSVWIIFAVGYLVYSILPADISTNFLLFPYRIVLPLILVALGAGLIDDAYGTGESRGFKGHIRAITKGKLTTGGLKLFSVSAASFVFAWMFFGITNTFGTGGFNIIQLVYALIAGAGIALTGNFMNLMDLRPARASKMYGLFAVLAIALMLARTGLPSFSLPADLGFSLTVLIVILNIVWICGPVLATFLFDAREEAMLGDAGSNAMGVFIGAFIVVHMGTNWWFLGLYTALMFLLNLLSEKVSFSRLIANNKVLSTLDNLGRLKRADSSLGHELLSVSNTDSENVFSENTAPYSDNETMSQEENKKIYGD